MKTSSRIPRLILSMIIAIAITLFGGSRVLAVDFAGGDGSEGNPYQITTPEQLNEVRNYDWKHFKLESDIDLTSYLSPGGGGYNDGAGWEPIRWFKGTLDGNGHTITGLIIDSYMNADYGLFSYMHGVVKNLGLVNVNVQGTLYAGGLAGQNYGTITNCYAQGTVSGLMAGGLVGSNDGGTITNCYAKSTVKSDPITNRWNAIYLWGFTAGGLVGYNSGTIINCYASGTVAGWFQGGLVGNNQRGTITNCYAVGTVGEQGFDKYLTGGLVGYNGGVSTITSCYYDRQTTGQSDIGKGTGKTTTEMMQTGTFSGWDFSAVWKINENCSYPYLYWQGLDGKGTLDNPYKISTPEQLNNVRYFSSKYFCLMNDIDLTDYLSSTGSGYNAGAGWDPIGTVESPFSGTFEGNGHTITGLFINRPDGLDNTGLFGVVAASGVVKNLGLVNVNVTGKQSIGALVGNNRGTIKNCYTRAGSVTGNQIIGGLIGCNDSGTITNCYATGSVTGSNAGGLVGFNGGVSTITSCYYDRQTSGQSDIGKGTGKTTAEMMQTGTFSGWDFTAVWRINENNTYPYLYSQQTHNITIQTPKNGTVSGGGTYPKEYQVTLKVTCNPGYTFAGWCAGESNLSSLPDYTFIVTADLTLTPIITPDDMHGDGTLANPYQITTPEQLYNVRHYTSKYFSLMNDIDLGGYSKVRFGWDPIGTSGNPFSGTFDGNGHTITTLIIIRGNQTGLAADSSGLFGVVAPSGVVKNLGLANIRILGNDKKEFGALVGYNRGTITNCYATTGDVYYGKYNGGLIGYNDSGTIMDCYTKCNVSTGSYDGGLIGYNKGGKITSCYATGRVGEIIIYGGGLIGYNEGGNITNCYATGEVISPSTNGGLIGYNDCGNITNCYARGQVIGEYGGGLIGYNRNANLIDCYATGWVSAKFAGGLVGYNENGTITNCYYDSQTTGQRETGKGTPLNTADMKNDAFAYNLNTTNSTASNSGTWSRTSNNSINHGYPFFADASNLPITTSPSQSSVDDCFKGF